MVGRQKGRGCGCGGTEGPRKLYLGGYEIYPAIFRVAQYCRETAEYAPGLGKG
jgi:hypothetical protein